MTVKSKLPRFPPRKARTSGRLINVVIQSLVRFSPIPNPIPQNSPYTPKEFYKILVLACITKTSISRKARELRERLPHLPSGETILRWVRALSLTELIRYQHEHVQNWLNALPEQFQRARKKGMILAIDFHTDPNYTKHPSEYIVTAKKKASTRQFFCYLTLLWVNAPEPVTLGVLPIPHSRSNSEVALEILDPWLETETILAIIADGEFYKWDLINDLCRGNFFFIIRGHKTKAVKQLLHQHAAQLITPGQGLVIPYTMKKERYKTLCPLKLVLWVDKKRTIPLVVPAETTWTACQIREFFRQRFTIETYYRVMHRFQAFSCSQHPVIRFVLVFLALWMSNLWCYFKAPLSSLKKSIQRV
ncbi:MAG: transposase, partial [Candidatus Hermodarchaeota archaeon]